MVGVEAIGGWLELRPAGSAVSPDEATTMSVNAGRFAKAFRSVARRVDDATQHGDRAMLSDARVAGLLGGGTHG
jgi:hypothetical protein